MFKLNFTPYVITANGRVLSKRWGWAGSSDISCYTYAAWYGNTLIVACMKVDLSKRKSSSAGKTRDYKSNTYIRGLAPDGSG